MRTALAMQIAGLGVLEFLTIGATTLRLILGVALVLGGSAVGVTGYRRWRRNERTIRAGAEMHTTRSHLPVVVLVTAVPAVAAILIALDY